MLSTSDLAKIYDTLLSIPGMNDTVKVELRIPRKNVLLLSRIIDRGLTVADDTPGGMLGSMDSETLQELTGIAGDILRKAGLTDMNEKLKAL